MPDTENDEKSTKSAQDSDESQQGNGKPLCPYMQNRELSWLAFNERVLDQGADPSVPLLERLQFVSIFWSNLQEFFMVRVGSLTDLNLLKKEIIDNKSNMTPSQQLDAVYARCHELYPQQEKIYLNLQDELAQAGMRRLEPEALNQEQAAFLQDHLETNVLPFLSPQIINARHPFPHLANGQLYIIVRLLEEEDKPKEEQTKAERQAAKEARKKAKALGAEGVTLGLVPLPRQARRVIPLPGDGFNFILLEDAIEMAISNIFSMYKVKHTNIICVTRNADLDATEGADEREEDYREHMKKILKKRARLHPVRLESKRKLSSTVSEFLMERLELEQYQLFTTRVPLDMGYAFGIAGMVDDETRAANTSNPFSPVWPACIKRNASVMEQARERELLLSYPYESMDPFIQMLREAAHDPNVVSIKITLYRLANQSHLAEALIAAAEAGKEVTALFELRARFDESNNIEWSQRFEEAGAKVIYGFHDYKVHSKICCITRQNGDKLEYLTQLGTGNYNEKTAKLYTDFSFITSSEAIGRDAVEFFRNMGMEVASRNYQTIWVAPLQIKQNICSGIDEQIALAKEGKPCGLFFKTNSITDKDIMEKLEQASRAGVPVTCLVRGISCLLPQVKGHTENIRVLSIVGRLLEHSRIYGFGPHDQMSIYLSSADLMTRNMDKRIEIAWPVLDDTLRQEVIDYTDTCLRDTAKLRELRADGTYTALRSLAQKGDEPFNSQEHLIAEARERSEAAAKLEGDGNGFAKLKMQATGAAAHPAQQTTVDLEETFREALKHEVPEDEADELAAVAVAAYEAVTHQTAGEDDAPAEKSDAQSTTQPAASKEATAPAAASKQTGAPTTTDSASATGTSQKAAAAPATPPRKHGFFWRLFHPNER